MKIPTPAIIAQIPVTIAQLPGTKSVNISGEIFVVTIGDVMNFINIKVITVKIPATNDQVPGNIVMKIPSGVLIEVLLMKYKMYSIVK